MIKCTCINNANCPIDFPLPSQWLEKGADYHIVDIKYVVKSETLAFKLAERTDPKLWPYTFFRSDRFTLTQESLQSLLQMLEGTYEPEITEKIKEKLKLQEI